jgi:hypothetical protein
MPRFAIKSDMTTVSGSLLREQTCWFLLASTRRFQTRQRAGEDLGALLGIHFGERVGVG